MSDIRLRHAVIISFAVFLATVAVGMIAVMQDSALGEQVLEMLSEELFGQILDDNPLMVSMKLFLNNLEACLFLFLGGASLGILTLFILTINGLFIGIAVEVVRQQQGPLFIAAAILPHGIFEIPAFIIAGSLGLLLGEALWREWQGAGEAASRARELGHIFVRLVVPLLAVAAFIEGFITPQIINVVI